MMEHRSDGGRYRLPAVTWIAFVALLALVQGAQASSGSTEIDRGRYLARAGNCVSCHTSVGGPAFAGV